MSARQRFYCNLAAGVFLGLCLLRFLWPIAGPGAWNPRIACEQHVFDVGRFPAGSAVKHNFTIRNTGLQPLVLKSIIRNRNLTQHRFRCKLRPLTIPPLSTATAAVEIDFPPQQVGAVSGWILLETNDPVRPTLKLTLRGIAVPDIRIVPERVSLGTIQSGETVCRTVKLSPAQAGKTFSVLDVTSASPNFLARCLPSEETAADFTLEIQNTESLQAGPAWGEIHIRTDHPHESDLVVRVFAWGLPDSAAAVSRQVSPKENSSRE